MAVRKAPDPGVIDQTALRGRILQNDSLSFERCFDPQEDALDELVDALHAVLFDATELAQAANPPAGPLTCFPGRQERGMS